MANQGTCLECSLVVGEEDNVDCFACGFAVHYRCLRAGKYLDATCKSEASGWFREMCTSKFWKFICKSCVAAEQQGTVSKPPSSSMELDGRLEKIEKNIELLIARDSRQNNQGERKSFAEAVATNVTAAVENATKKTFARCMRDTEEEKERSKMLIFDGVQATFDEGNLDREHDLQVAKSLSEFIVEGSATMVTSVSRLGQHNGTNSERPLPLRVTFNNAAIRMQLLRSRSCLKEYKSDIAVYVRPFLSPECQRQKQLLQAAVKIANERHTFESSVAVIYNSRLDKFAVYQTVTNVETGTRKIEWDQGERILPDEILSAAEHDLASLRRQRLAARRMPSSSD